MPFISEGDFGVQAPVGRQPVSLPKETYPPGLAAWPRHSINIDYLGKESETHTTIPLQGCPGDLAMRRAGLCALGDRAEPHDKYKPAVLTTVCAELPVEGEDPSYELQPLDAESLCYRVCLGRQNLQQHHRRWARERVLDNCL
jgi:hypothetical protein